MIFPYRQKNPPESLPIGTCVLIFFNVLVFFLTTQGLSITEEVVNQYAYRPSQPTVMRMFASMFLHGDLLHLLGNMWFLYLFGFSVEGRLRTWRFLPLYFLAGIVASLMQVVATGADIPQIGASGAVMGALGAALWMFPFAKMQIFYWFGWFFVGTWEWHLFWLGLYYVGLDLFMGYALQPFGESSGGTAHWAHVGGALAGGVLAIVMFGKRDSRSVSESKEHIADSGDLIRLDRSELMDLARVQPDNWRLATPWLYREAEFGRVSAACHSFFLRHFEEAVSREDVQLLARAVHMALVVDRAATPLTPAMAIRVGLQSERQGNAQGAVALLDEARRMATATDSDKEAATFRLAQIREMWLGDPVGSHALYSEFVTRWPMSPLAGQARSRVAELVHKLPPRTW